MFVRVKMLAALLLTLAACKGSRPADATAAGDGGTPGPKKDETVSLNGAGATFPYPLYSKWISEYNKLNPNVKINYQSIGSGGGIRQIIAGTVDFGATDAPMKGDESKQAPSKLLHIPATIGAVVIAYNVPEVTGTLRLAPEALVEIYAGKIRNWNDPKIKADNPNAKLPAKEISVVYRTDGSGTTSVFTDYLSKISPEWRAKVGAGKSVDFPLGLGAKGNEGVTGQVKTSPYTIGYIERAYASQNKLPMIEIRNKAGKFVAPSTEAMSAAAASVEMPDELFVSLSNADGDAAYPITSYSYLLLYENAKDPVKGAALARYVWWGLHDGQKFSKALDYAPIPDKVLSKVEAQLKALRSGDKKLLSGS